MNGFHYLYEAYVATDKNYTGKVTVPTLWDKKTKRIVNNESSEIIRMLDTEFNAITGNKTEYYPRSAARQNRRHKRAAFITTSTTASTAAASRNRRRPTRRPYDGLFATLDNLEQQLSRQRYLVGSQITEADWRLFPTLVRFDVAYFSLFKCNKKRVADYPNLSNYMRELYQMPGVADTVKPRYYVINYYSIAKLNPTEIIPKGTPVDLGEPHDRARLAA